MERIHSRDLDDLHILDITDTTEGPAQLLLGLQRYPNVQVDRIPVSPDTPEVVRGSMLSIRENIGRAPLALVLCHAGLYRSYLVSAWLVDQNLATLATPNLDLEKEDVAGCGYDYLDLIGLGLTGEGLSIHYRIKRAADIVILNLSTSKGRYGDRATLARFSLMMENLLERGPELKKPLTILWLEGIEDDFREPFKAP